MSGVILASAHGEAVGLLVIGILGGLLSAAVFLVPGVFDAATRMRLRTQGLRDDDERVLSRDRQRRRFIAMVLGVGSLAMLATALTRL
jgi:TctA family transporter